MPDYHLVVIGSGPAGEKGAAQAAYYGKRVAIVEREPHVGGSAINTGTIPSKTLRETALYFSGLRQRGLYGIDYSLKEGLTVKDFMHREHVVVAQQRKTIRQNLERHKIEIVWGSGAIVAPHTVRVRTAAGETRDLHTAIILIATGSSPYHPPAVPFDGRRIYDSDSILKMQFIPKTMAVVGGGVIGCEYASVFTALGVAVTLVESREGLLPAIDHEIAGRLQAQLEQLGLPPVLPYAIYTIPEIAIAGLTEEECVAKGIPYLVGRAEYAQNPRGQIIGETHGMLRLIFSPADKKLLGAHHIGELSSELVHIGAHALFDGATIDEFIMSVYNYPTLSDVYKYAAYDGLGAWERWQA